MAAIKNTLDAPRYYVPEKADRVVQFFYSLKFTKGEFKGRPFKLEKWQEEKIIRPLFGTLWADGARCYTTAYISTPRKNGKTEMGAGLALYLLCGDGEQGAEVYSAAGDKEQAAMVYNAAEIMVKTSPALNRRCRIIHSQRRIIYLPTGGYYRVISADAPLKQGFNPHGVLYDELHVAKNRELWDALSTGQGARRQPLMAALTTAGHDLKTICGEQYILAKQIKEKKITNPTYFSFIAEADPKDDWQDPKTWEKANPNYNISVIPRKMESEALAAKLSPSKENTFKRYLLNLWTNASEGWLNFDVWKKSAGTIDTASLTGRDCYAALDLSTTTDIAAFLKIFPVKEEIIDGATGEKKIIEVLKVLPRFYIPADNMVNRSKKDRVPYDLWHKQGYILTTEGNVIDYEFIERDIIDDSKKYNLIEIGYDPWNATGTVNKLTAAGLKMIPARQGFALSSPTKETEILINQHRIHHGNNPVLDWMLANVQITRDAQENIKPDKKKSSEKIDGIVALIMAVDRYIRRPATDTSAKESGQKIHIF